MLSAGETGRQRVKQWLIELSVTTHLSFPLLPNSTVTDDTGRPRVKQWMFELSVTSHLSFPL